MLRNIILVITFVLGALVLQAQDRHFSQFYTSPLTLNPALTGAFNAKYRLGLINRDQWRSVLDNPYRTFAASLEVKFGLKEFLRFAGKDKVAVGIVFYNDKVEGVDFRETRMAFSLAYHKSLDKASKNVLTIGFQAGVSQRNINFTDLIFDDQFNEIDAFDLATSEPIPVNNFTFGDYSIGLNYSAAVSRDLSLFAGAALHHIFEPRISFFEDRAAERLNVILPRNITAHAGAAINFGSRYQVSPRASVLTQAGHFQVTGGANLRVRLDEYDKTGVYAGLWARIANDALNGLLNDSVILTTGLEIEGFLLGLSYDLNTIAASTLNTQQGAFEISFVYLGEYENETILCPKF